MIPETAAAPLLAITSTFTAEPVREALAFWMKELGWNYDIRFAPYNQVFQQLLDPAGLLRANRNGVNVVLLRLEDWARFSDSGSSGRRRPGAKRGSVRLRAAIGGVLFRFSAAGVHLSRVAPVSGGPRARRFSTADGGARGRGRRGLKTVHVVAAAEASELYPVAEAHDPHADELGHVPYTPAFFAALGTLIVRKIHALRMPPYKVIVLDCDDTLWKGICGEDGPQGIVLDPPRRALQEFMLAQHDAGKLLCLVSKNNIEDVLDTFRHESRDAAASRSFRLLAHQLEAEIGESGRAGRRAGARSRHLHPGGRQPQGVLRNGGASAGGAGAGAARRAGKDPGIPAARMGLRPPAGDGGGSPPHASCTRSRWSAGARKSRRRAWRNFWSRCNWTCASRPWLPTSCPASRSSPSAPTR